MLSNATGVVPFAACPKEGVLEEERKKEEKRKTQRFNFYQLTGQLSHSGVGWTGVPLEGVPLVIVGFMAAFAVAVLAVAASHHGIMFTPG